MKTKIFYDFEATSVARDADMISVGLVAVTEKKIGRTNFPEKQALEYVKNAIFNPNANLEVKTFYAEFTDFNIEKCDDWVKENIVGKLHLKERFEGWNRDKNVPLFEHFKNKSYFNIKAETNAVIRYLKDWLSQFEEIEFWADFDVIDKPMLIDLIANWELRDLDEKGMAYLKARPEIGEGGIMKHTKIGLPKHLSNIKYDRFFDLHTLFKIKGIDTDINREEFSEVRQQVIPLPFSDYDKTHNALFDAYVSWLCYNKLMKI